MKEKLAKLIDVKSIMTLLLTLVFCVLALTGVVAAEQFLTIFTVIVGFYFGTQAQKTAATAKATEPAGTLPTQTNAQHTNQPYPEAVYAETQPPDGTVGQIGFEY